MAADPLLRVRDLHVRYRARDEAAPVTAVEGVSFDIAAGEAVGVLGESGCGKTSLALAIPGLLPPAGEIAGGSVRFGDDCLSGLPESRLEKIRGAEIGVVFQEPAVALHPTRRVGVQVAEVLRAHRPWDRRRCRIGAWELLAEVGLEQVADAYPHQLAGGQRQRVVIAQALACRPRLLIADEPTAMLDVTTQARVLALLRRLQRRLGIALFYVSHDPRLLAEIADRLLVMYAGRLVEEGPCGRVLEDPLHPYAEALLRCLPPPDAAAGRRLAVIPGEAVTSGRGCRFATRCSHELPGCREHDPPPVHRSARRVWCFRYGPGDAPGG